jgi:hypothetical protein
MPGSVGPRVANCVPLQVGRLQSDQANLRKKVALARAEAAKCSSPATFAQSAKHQRRANALEKEVAGLEEQQVGFPGE